MELIQKLRNELKQYGNGDFKPKRIALSAPTLINLMSYKEAFTAGDDGSLRIEGLPVRLDGTISNGKCIVEYEVKYR
jgi:hypothetical protein